ncbi:MAG: hypothetical protein JW993_19645 [Sedimentisphaerales bacterium]|nr:hypothetical protein [Sedimentisphaerales bacterium]
MATAIVVVIVIASLLVIASGIWVAIGLVTTLTGPKSERPTAQECHDAHGP